jgi:hypothetical protein
MDIEFARWGNRLAATNAQYVVQPQAETTVNRFKIVMTGDWSVHEIDWSRDLVSFDSRHGHLKEGLTMSQLPPMKGPAAGPAWSYRGPGIPASGDETVHINFYLFDGRAPMNGKEAELLVSGFWFIPHATGLDAGLER